MKLGRGNVLKVSGRTLRVSSTWSCSHTC